MLLYKLTDSQGYTRRGASNECLWGEGVTHTATGEGGLCSDGVIHAYRNPLQAVLMNPCHAAIEEPLLWEAEGDIVEESADKLGVKTLTTLKQLDLPNVTTEQRVRFAIAMALEVYDEHSFVKWAMDWLTGRDRSATAAAHASYATSYAAYATTASARAAAAAATYAARAAIYAAYAAADAATAGRASYAAHAAAADAAQITSQTLIAITQWAVTEAPYEGKFQKGDN